MAHLGTPVNSPATDAEDRFWDSTERVERVEHIEHDPWASTEHSEHVEHDPWDPTEHGEHVEHVSWDAMEHSEHVYHAKFKSYEEEEEGIERSLHAPRVIPMVTKYEERSITRAEALEKVQPIMNILDATNGTADVMTAVKTNFTRRTVKVLPPREKALIGMNAALNGEPDILQWICAAREDMEDYSWLERVKVPNLSAKQLEDVWDDLDTLSWESPIYLARLLDTRIQTVKTLFKAQERRIQKLERQIQDKTCAFSRVENEVDDIRGKVESLFQSLPREEIPDESCEQQSVSGESDNDEASTEEICEVGSGEADAAEMDAGEVDASEVDAGEVDTGEFW